MSGKCIELHHKYFVTAKLPLEPSDSHVGGERELHIFLERFSYNMKYIVCNINIYSLSCVYILELDCNHLWKHLHFLQE